MSNGQEALWEFSGSSGATSSVTGQPLVAADPTATGASETFTERQLLDRLRKRHSQVVGNGPVWSFMEHVRNDAGFNACTTIDALALHHWPSRGHEVHAYEVKVSRSDYRRELVDDCAKSAPWRAWVDYFWIVAPAGVGPAGGVVPLHELPTDWGLLVTRGAGLAVARRAKRLTPPRIGYLPRDPLPRGLVAAMLRACARTGATP